MENDHKVKIKTSDLKNPMFVITGIYKGYSNDEFISELLRLNSDIENDLNISNIDKQIKIVAKKNCRNATKENWILQAPPDITIWFLKRETVCFDLMRVYVQEHVNLAFCWNCCGFEHVAKHCKDKVYCYQCAEEHSGKDCTGKALK